jgi:hypothetical protein
MMFRVLKKKMWDLSKFSYIPKAIRKTSRSFLMSLASYTVGFPRRILSSTN